ncbi:hypothetical protein MRX96_014389 [Rhipicephalus microplus]
MPSAVNHTRNVGNAFVPPPQSLHARRARASARASLAEPRVAKPSPRRRHPVFANSLRRGGCRHGSERPSFVARYANGRSALAEARGRCH